MASSAAVEYGWAMKILGLISTVLNHGSTTLFLIASLGLVGTTLWYSRPFLKIVFQDSRRVSTGKRNAKFINLGSPANFRTSHRSFDARSYHTASDSISSIRR